MSKNDAGGARPGRVERRPRAWWQWVLGVGLLGAAAASLLMRYVPGLAPKFQKVVPPHEIRVSADLKPADTVPGTPGELAGCNLLLVTFDTTRADHIACYGNDQVDTPALDRLAHEGALVKWANAVAPVTLPSHTSIMTSLYPFHHGVRANTWFSLSEDRETIAERLHASGYSTAAFISAFVLDARFGLDQGFDLYDDDVGLQRPMQNWVRLVPERRGDETVDHAEAWLKEHAHEKFFTWIHLWDPHYPYYAPEPYSSRYKLPYDAEIAFADAQLGRLLTLLDDEGIADKTLVIVVGDHGDALGQHGEPTHALQIYQATMHVPMLFRCGKRLGGGVVVDRVASHVDVLPTALSLLGIQPPAGIDGTDLTQAADPERALFMETLEGLFEHSVAPLLGVRDGMMKYIHGPDAELYDLSADPFEEKNLVDSKPQVATELRHQLEGFFGSDLTQAGSADPTRAITSDELEKMAALGYVGNAFGGGAPAADALIRPQDALKDMREFSEVVGMAVEEKDEDKGFARLAEFAKQHPSNFQAYQALAQAHSDRGEFDQAEQVLMHCLDLRPDAPQILWTLAKVNESQRRFDGAVKWYTVLLEKSPEHLGSLKGLGELYLIRGKYLDAAKYLKQAFAVGRYDRALPDELATTMTAISRIDEAIALFETALAEHPDLPMARNALARLYMSKARYADAIDTLRKGIELMPNEHELENNLACLLATCPERDLMRPFEAIAMLERLCRETEYKDPRYLHSLAMVYSTAWRMDEAISIARKAHEIALASDKPEFVQMAPMIGAAISDYERMRDEGSPTTQEYVPDATTQPSASQSAQPAEPTPVSQPGGDAPPDGDD